jgi:hypothetical protein
MIFKEIVNRILLEPFLFLLLTVTFINILFLIKTIAGGNRTNFSGVVDTYATDFKTATHNQEEVVNKLDSDLLVKQELPLRKSSKQFESNIRNRTLTEKEEVQNCEYCKIFKNLGTAVCPNCGGLLNLRSQLENINVV